MIIKDFNFNFFFVKFLIELWTNFNGFFTTLLTIYIEFITVTNIAKYD